MRLSAADDCHLAAAYHGEATLALPTPRQTEQALPVAGAHTVMWPRALLLASLLQLPVCWGCLPAVLLLLQPADQQNAASAAQQYDVTRWYPSFFSFPCFIHLFLLVMTTTTTTTLPARIVHLPCTAQV